MYSLIGDDDSTQFFQIDPNSGQIKLKASIADQVAELYRVGIP